MILASVAMALGESEPPSVFVWPSGSIQADGFTSDELNRLVMDEVAGYGGVKVVAWDEFLQKWCGGNVAEAGDLAWIPMHSEDTMMRIKERQKALRIDLMMTVAIRKDGKATLLKSVIFGVDNGKIYELTSELRPGDLRETVKRDVALLLGKARDVLNVQADKILDSIGSTVAYYLPASDDNTVELRCTYERTRPDPYLRVAKFMPAGPAEGQGSYKLRTVDGREIVIKGRFEKGDFVDVSVYTAPPPGAKDPQDETLSVLSSGGHVINFFFDWEQGSLAGVTVKPMVNPYGEIS
jgi:hypothetical protein